ncbi:MAG: hypothetical protein LAP86_18510 [Acidobacteriia bacterium]|nr:hypothetical protein [Terriglobia bacterium]
MKHEQEGRPQQPPSYLPDPKALAKRVSCRKLLGSGPGAKFGREVEICAVTVGCDWYLDGTVADLLSVVVGKDSY